MQPEPIRYAQEAPRPPDGPISLTELGAGPCELDIGFGRGRSLFERAQIAPSGHIVGIEINQKWAVKTQERALGLGLNNVTVFCGDAREILARCAPEPVVSRAFVHFPDPWWKKRHQKRRVIGEALLDALARLFVPKAELFIQTDVADRAHAYLEAIDAHPAFVRATPSGLIDHNPFGARSNREVRAIADGLPIYRLLARAVAP